MWQQNSGVVEDFIFTVFRSLSTNLKVKKLLKSVNICQSYRKNKSGTFLLAHGVVYMCQKNSENWLAVNKVIAKQASLHFGPSYRFLLTLNPLKDF